jgi:DNA-binding transcriptional MerR regulator
MFTVGEFSKIAQVSKRSLRYYDEIGLFTPVRIDLLTNRRYYSAGQMTRLNRILALKDLGLSLEQIQRLLQDEVSTDEMQGMLLLKKAEIENHLQSEIQRIRRIESRLHAIRDTEENKPLNVVIKQMSAQPVLRTRLIAQTFETALDTMQRIRARLPESKRYGLVYCICHEDNVSVDDMELEIGCFVESESHAIVPLSDNIQLQYHELPPVELMASSVVRGPLERILLGYGQIGQWAEANGYRTLGMPVEVTLQLPESGNTNDLITEVRYPVELASLDYDEEDSR